MYLQVGAVEGALVGAIEGAMEGLLLGASILLLNNKKKAQIMFPLYSYNFDTHTNCLQTHCLFSITLVCKQLKLVDKHLLRPLSKKNYNQSTYKSYFLNESKTYPKQKTKRQQKKNIYKRKYTQTN